MRGTEGGGGEGDAMMEKLETQEEQKQDDNRANPAPLTNSDLLFTAEARGGDEARSKLLL